MIIQTWSEHGSGPKLLAAGPKRQDRFDCLQRSVYGPGAVIWAEIFAAVLLDASCERNARKRLGKRDFNIRISLVVFQ